MVYLFIDGLGIPREPIFRETRIFNFCQGDLRRGPIITHMGGLVIPTDALLGIPGIPQSATGQTALFTGINAAAIVGRHLSGYPTPLLKRIIEKWGIFVRLKRKGWNNLSFLNAFTPLFFSGNGMPLSTTTYNAIAAKVRLKTLEDLKREEALYQDFTNHYLIKKGYKVDPWSPKKAGRILATLAHRYHFILYEYFITDRVGHMGSKEEAIKVMMALDEMLSTFLFHADLGMLTVILSSDHGNVEEPSIITHSKNPVPTIIWGRSKELFCPKIRSIQDITPLIEDLFSPHCNPDFRSPCGLTDAHNSHHISIR